MGNQNHVGGLDFRWFQGLSWKSFFVAGEIGVDEKCVFVAFNFESGGAKPCEFHAVPRGFEMTSI